MTSPIVSMFSNLDLLPASTRASDHAENYDDQTPPLSLAFVLKPHIPRGVGPITSHFTYYASLITDFDQIMGSSRAPSSQRQ